MNRKRLVLISITSFILFIGWRSDPPDLRTGATSNSTCASSSCHAPDNTNIDGTLNLLGLPDDLTPGQSYDITVQVKMTSGNPERAGFQMVALDSEKRQVGSFESIGDNNVGIATTNDIEHVDHSNAIAFSGDDADFMVRWTAPMDMSPDVWSFYAVSILANGNGSRTGDKFKSIVLSRSVGTVLDQDNDGFNNDVDCDDNDPNINPDAQEIVNNDVDENCDGTKEMIDVDQDGFNSDDDCNDDDASINPGAMEIPNNDIDEDCDGNSDIIDMDQDGFNSDDDCDDTDATVNPNASEIPNNDVDEDCDGEILVIDNDEDGFNSSEDCNDEDPLINPDAEEIMADGKDNNCDGEIDECICTTDAMPVCGSDGNTYSNGCQAECVGITEYTDGPCATMSGITGKVVFLNDQGLSNLMVKLSDGREVMADSDGSFSIDSIGMDSTLSISFSKNDNHANGLSSLDLVQIINHILGKTPFTDEVKILAADADGNGSVSSIDLVQIINVILGRNSEFPSRESWGFLPESILVSGIEQGVSVDVRAYKVGDVNESADPN